MSVFQSAKGLRADGAHHPRDRRIPVMMTSAEVEVIDNWMFESRIRTRAGAIRALIGEGLKALEGRS
jgi:hypothetical protein